MKIDFGGVCAFMAAVFGMGFLFGPGHAIGAENYYQKRVWGAFNGGEMNTSLLVFRDMNRNGIYDLGDRPMPHVAVEFGKFRGSPRLDWTNISGFANFRMSVARRDREVVDPGLYAFRAVPPPGWSITTGNQIQESDYVVMPGAPGDMIALKTTHPVGLAPDLTISGRAAPGAHVSAIGPDDVSRSQQGDADGQFSIPVTPGLWQIEVSSGQSGKVERRKVTVEQVPVVLAAFLGRTGVDEELLPKLHVASFDDVMTAGDIFELASGYGGLDWYNVVVAHQRFYGGPGYINTAMSGEFIAYNSSGHPAEIASPRPFDFVGAYAGAGWDSAEGETLLIKAWRGKDLAYEDRVALSAMGPVYFAADYRRVTRVEIRTEHYWQAAIDDFTYRTGE